jgi:hypothetical protein
MQGTLVVTLHVKNFWLELPLTDYGVKMNIYSKAFSFSFLNIMSTG